MIKTKFPKHEELVDAHRNDDYKKITKLENEMKDFIHKTIDEWKEEIKNLKSVQTVDLESLHKKNKKEIKELYEEVRDVYSTLQEMVADNREIKKNMRKMMGVGN